MSPVSPVLLKKNGMFRHPFLRVGEDISSQHILLPPCNYCSVGLSLLALPVQEGGNKGNKTNIMAAILFFIAFENRTLKRSVIEWIRNSNVRNSSPDCTSISQIKYNLRLINTTQGFTKFGLRESNKPALAHSFEIYLFQF